MMPDSSPSTILFAQVNRFSYTNDALSTFMKPHLGDMKLEEFRVYPVIRRNPFLLLCCLLAVAWYYGIGTFLNPKAVPEKMVKTPTFFDLSGWLIRRRAGKIKNLSAVLQTQGLFNARYRDLPLIIYTDNTILNRINKPAGGNVRKSPIVDRERRLYEAATVIAVTAGHVATSLVEDYGIKQAAIQVVLIGANAPPAPPSPEGRYGEKHILFVGIDWERKGGPELVEAFRTVSDDFADARLTIVGCDPAADHRNIDVKGRIPPAEVTRLMAVCSIYCMPSHIEPSSVAVIEAARSGLPVIGTATGGFLDSVVPDKTGILVPPGDADALAAAMRRLLADPGLCASMGAAGQEWVKQFDWNVVAEKVAHIVRNSAVISGR